MADNCENFINRELSWLDFNYRILHEARDKEHPLFERVKFLGITASNLDEFFMVRVASLKNLILEGSQKRDAAGMNASEQLERILKKAHAMVDEQYSVLNRSLVPLMQSKGYFLRDFSDLAPAQQAYAKRYFFEEVYPVLTPMAVDSSRPFPLIPNKSLNLCALVEKKDKKDKKKAEFATVTIPGVLPRFVKLPSAGDSKTYILLEKLIQAFLPSLFTGHDVLCSYFYRVMRDAEFSIDEDDAEDLLEEISKKLKKRERSSVIRLDVEENIDKKLLSILKKELDVHSDDIYKVTGPVDLTFLEKLYSEGSAELKFEPKKPQEHPRLAEGDIFSNIREGDILMHHPYDSFAPVIDLVKKSASDPNVLAIKQTLYRVSGNSPIIKYLSEAAGNGKQVTVLVELKARFDEENNIVWAKKLEKSGCHVIYGLLGLKTHSKITVVVRREEDGIRRYVHLGTGNYNDITARFYTDMGILTCNDSIGEDATAFFNMISGFCEPRKWNHLVLAPLWLRKRTAELIENEIKNAESGKDAYIIAKCNSLIDKDIIELLYKASAAGVRISLIVRGICGIKAGVSGLSENIAVRSVVGRYLEHTRIYCFANGGDERIYLSSADWMPRNFDKRVEIMFPVLDEDLRRDVRHVLDVQLADTMRSYIQTGGVYEKADGRGKKRLDCQVYFQQEAEDRIRRYRESRKKPETERIFVPRMKPETGDDA